METENVPALQGLHADGAAAPSNSLYEPAPQGVHVAPEAAPVTLDHVPIGQGVGSYEETGQ